jgi:microcystin degradation protein MlrC
MRIAVGGIGHETNTFSTLRTGLDDFTIRRGDEIANGAFWDRYREAGVEWVPTLAAKARPHGPVEQGTYLQLKEELLERLKSSLPVDGVFLELHGAMEVEGTGDGEADLARAVRGLAGEDALIAASLDLHANIEPAFVASTDILSALRTAPHQDHERTRERVVTHLVRCIREGIRPAQALIKPPLLLPGEHAVTDVEPARSLYRMVESAESVPGILDASLLIGCAWTDSPHTSTSVIVVAEQEADLAYRQAARIAGEVWDRREAFAPAVPTVPVDAAVSRALASPEGPVFVSDSGDNVGAGGAGDIPLFVESLLAAGARDTAVAGLSDPEALSRCADAGTGARISLEIGGKLDRVNGKPLAVTGEVAHLDSRESPTSAVFRVDGVDIVLIAGRWHFPTLASLRSAGIEPLTRKAIVMKLGYLYPELLEHAAGAIMALSPGFTDQRIDTLPYKRVRRPIYPLDGDFTWEPAAEYAGPSTEP